MNKKEELLKNAPFKELFLKLCVPTVVIMLVMIIYNMADVFFIGQTGDSTALAAVSLCTPIFTIISGLGTLFGGGGCTLISLSLGKRDSEKAKAVTAFCLIGTMTVSLIMAIAGLFATPVIASALGADSETMTVAVTYLRIIAIGSPIVLCGGTFCNIIRADGSAVNSMIANMLGTLTNIILDGIFILAFKWGVMGAALATVIGNALTVLYLIRFLSKNELYRPSFKDFKQEKNIAGQVLSLGIPTACSAVVMSIATIFANRMIISYGNAAMAAQGVASKFSMLTSMLVMGICLGLQPVISYAYSANDSQRIRNITKNTVLLNFIIGCVLAVAGILLREQIVTGFIDDEAVRKVGSIMITGAFGVAPFAGGYQYCQTYLQSTGKPLYATILSLLDKGLLYIPILFVLSRIFGLGGIAFTQAVTTFCSLGAGIFLCINRNKQQRGEKIYA